MAYSTDSLNNSIVCATTLEAPTPLRLAVSQRLDTALLLKRSGKRPIMVPNNNTMAICPVVEPDLMYKIATKQRCIEAVRVPTLGQGRLWHETQRQLQDFSSEKCLLTCKNFVNDPPFYISFEAASATSPAECYCCDDTCTMIYSPGVVTNLMTA